MIQRPTHSWIAYKPNGSFHDAILHDPAQILSVARNVADWMRRGFTVEYVPNSVVTSLLEPTVTIKPTVSTMPIVPTVNAVVSVGTMVTMSIEAGKQDEARDYVTSEMGVCE